MNTNELEFADEAIKANTEWPALSEGNEPEPSGDDLNVGWAKVLDLQSAYSASIGEDRIETIETAIAEATADYHRAGWSRKDIQERLTAMVRQEGFFTEADGEASELTSREKWLENNKAIMVGEGASEDEIFFNQIETRLAFATPAFETDYSDESDVRLVNAYVNSLAQYEAEGEYAAWAPLSVEHLVEHEGLTPREAGVIVIIAAREYPTKEVKSVTSKDSNEKPEIDVAEEERLDGMTRGILRNACDELGLEYNNKDDRLDKPLAFDLVRFALWLDPMDDFDALAIKALKYTGE